MELAALTEPLRALGITSGPGQCPCSLDGPELHVPGSCDRGFLDLSWGLGLSIKRRSSSHPSCLFHPLALITSLDLNYPRHSQNANKGLSPSFLILTLWPCLLHILKRNSMMRGLSVGLWLRAGTLQSACLGSDPSLAADHCRHLGVAYGSPFGASLSSSAEWG